MVYRIFVEKKAGLDNEAKGLLNEAKNLLGIESLEDIRLFNRYDAENITEELFSYAVKTVFSEPQLDNVSENVEIADAFVFAVEALPGQFDQRADSAAQCIQIISQGERPLIRTAKVYALYGALTEADIEAFKKLLEENKGEIAAVIAQPYNHGNFNDNSFPIDGFWKDVRELCTKNDIVLIVDDVRCGFRLDLAGSDHFFGFEADIICFCKALANGYNMSAFCGKEFLRNAASSLSYTGSYWMSAVPFAACIATINKLKKIDAPKLFDAMGRELTDGFKKAGAEHGFDLVVSGAPALFYLRIANDDSLLLHQDWVAECVNRGMFITSHHNHFINAALTKEDINRSIEIAEDAFKAVKKNHPELG